MPTFYHLTPERNLPGILKQGLLPARPTRKTFGKFLDEDRSYVHTPLDTTGRVTLGNSPSECLDFIESFRGPQGWAGENESMALLEVRIPRTTRLYRDDFDYPFITSRISPSRIRVLRRGIGASRPWRQGDPPELTVTSQGIEPPLVPLDWQEKGSYPSIVLPHTYNSKSEYPEEYIEGNYAEFLRKKGLSPYPQSESSEEYAKKIVSMYKEELANSKRFD